MVHFSISDIDEDETYVLEIGAHRLAEGSGTDAEEVSGQLAMPDFGGGERKVTVEAEIGERATRRPSSASSDISGLSPGTRDRRPVA